MESNYNKKFDQQVRKKFEDFSAEVSPSLWAAIETEIKPEEIKANKMFNLKRYRYIRYISVAAVLLIIGFTIWQIQPEEKIFLRGQETVEETGLVQELEIKQSTGDKIRPVAVENNNKVVSRLVSKPVSLALANNDDGAQLLHDSQLAIEQKTEGISTREPLLAVNIPMEKGNTSLLNDVSATPSLVQTLDITSKNLDSLYQVQYTVENESEGRQKIVSGILNFVVGNLQIGEDRRVEFTENEHGIIKIGLKGIFAKNDR